MRQQVSGKRLKPVVDGCYTIGMATKPIPVRLDEKLVERLASVSAKMGSNSAAIMRLCVTSFLDDFERRGTAALPLQWEDLIERLDGRTSAAKSEGVSLARSDAKLETLAKKRRKAHLGSLRARGSAGHPSPTSKQTPNTPPATNPQDPREGPAAAP